MKNKNIIFTVIGAVLFNTIFWEEGLGLNMIIFSAFIIICNKLMNKVEWNKNSTLTLIGTILSLGALFCIHSDLSALSVFVSLFVFIGFMHHKELKSISNSFLTIFMSCFHFRKFKFQKIGIYDNFDTWKWKRRFKVFVLPFILLTVFVIIFRSANPIFDDLFTSFTSIFSFEISSVFERISITRFIFFIFGLMITSAMLVKSSKKYFVNKDISKKFNLKREKGNRNPIIELLKIAKNTNPIALKNERFSVILTFGFINFLLLIVNGIDIIFVWFNKASQQSENLSKVLHEGTYLLIASVLLSMMIMLFVFRKNQNFYKPNLRLKKFAYAWIVQNVILVISVVIRNLNYISEFGLTYKRIGIFVFLSLTIIGLYHLYIKIKDKKTIHYLVYRNGWAVYFLLISMSLINWDACIVNYNLKYMKSNTVDYSYLLRLSDNALIRLLKHQKTTEDPRWFEERKYYESFDERLNTKIRSFKHYSNRTFLSWNFAHYRIEKQINKD